MPPVQFYDRLEIGDNTARETRDGYMVASARTARQGIQIYRGSEVGRPEMDSVRVFRPASEVFKNEAMASFAHKPITLDHPPEMVNARNWKKYAHGSSGDEVVRDGDYIRVPLILSDAGAINDVKSGKQCLSAGYMADIFFESGVTDKGEEFDAIQRNISANHIAVVDAARAGPECRIHHGDRETQNRQTQETRKMTTRTIMVDGLSVETTDQGAQAVEKLQRQIVDADKKLSDAIAAHAAAIAAKDKELGTKDAEIEGLKKKQVTDAQLDVLATERAAVIASAKSIAPELKTDTLGITAIRKAAVAVKLGDEKVKDKSDDYCHALFDALTADATKNGAGPNPRDPVRDAISQGRPIETADAAHGAMVADMKNRWKGDTKSA